MDEGAAGQVIRLRDGRELAYGEWGSPDGAPVLFFHGSPGGRLTRYGHDSLYRERGIRLVTADRPGIGRSSPMPGRSVVDWAEDIEELADHLGLERFAVVSYSAGSAYGLACMARLRSQVSAAALVSPAGRLDHPGFVDEMATARYQKLARRAPWAMAFVYSTVARRGRKDPDAAHELFFRGASRVDRAVLDRPEVKQRWMAAYLDATQRGGRGLAEDMRVVQRPWGFDPEMVDAPVHLWHGDADRITPRPHAEHWVEVLSDCRPVWLHDEGHFLIEDHIDEILRAVARSD